MTDQFKYLSDPGYPELKTLPKNCNVWKLTSVIGIPSTIVVTFLVTYFVIFRGCNDSTSGLPLFTPKHFVASADADNDMQNQAITTSDNFEESLDFYNLRGLMATDNNDNSDTDADNNQEYQDTDDEDTYATDEGHVDVDYFRDGSFEDDSAEYEKANFELAQTENDDDDAQTNEDESNEDNEERKAFRAKTLKCLFKSHTKGTNACKRCYEKFFNDMSQDDKEKFEAEFADSDLNKFTKSCEKKQADDFS